MPISKVVARFLAYPDAILLMCNATVIAINISTVSFKSTYIVITPTIITAIAIMYDVD